MTERFGDEHKQQLLRLATGLRALVESSVALSAPLDELSAMADAVEELGARAAAHAGERPFPRYGTPVDGDLSGILPWGVVSGRYNPIAAPVTMRIEGGKAFGIVRFGLAYEGPPGGVHGGVVALVYDQVLAFAALANGTPGHTGTLTTRYRGITPLHIELRFEAWVEKIEGRKISTRGRCVVDGEVVSEAEGVFIRFRDGVGAFAR